MSVLLLCQDELGGSRNGALLPGSFVYISNHDIKFLIQQSLELTRIGQSLNSSANLMAPTRKPGTVFSLLHDSVLDW